jgi:CRISPR-associated protein (TIGR02584 family)
VKNRPPVSLREIRVVTTRIGDECVRDHLLHPERGWFQRFWRDFAIPPGAIRFDPSSILVSKRSDGQILEDVRTSADNLLVADSILSLVRKLTKDPATALHCSVAGGRRPREGLPGLAAE